MIASKITKYARELYSIGDKYNINELVYTKGRMHRRLPTL